jgi:hypothetical protein
MNEKQIKKILIARVSRMYSARRQTQISAGGWENKEQISL